MGSKGTDLPRNIGKYRIDALVGEGAMGVVYRAFDPSIERAVALKTIRRELLDGDGGGSVLARFRNEARAAGRLMHPNIVAIHDFGDDDAYAYIAMEFVDGQPLSRRMAGGRMPTATAVGWIGQVLGALDYAHARGVIHRDIKPSNILVTPDGGIKVADFGIARLDASELTQHGSVVGTPSYMSPEQMAGAPLDGRSDLYAVGIVLYQLLTGERPFGPPSADGRVAPPRPPSHCVASLGAAYDPIVARALARAPSDRYADARAMLAALQAVAQGADDSATRIAARPAAERIAAPQAERSAGDLAAPVPEVRRGAGAGTRVEEASPSGAAIDWRRVVADPLQTALVDCAGLIPPMARLVVQRAIAGSADPAGLCTALDAHVATDAARARIRRTVDLALASTAGSGAAPGTAGLSDAARSTGSAAAGTRPTLEPAQRDRLVRTLSDLVGPIARLVVERAAQRATDERDLLRRIAAEIPQPAQRARFLALSARSAERD